MAFPSTSVQDTFSYSNGLLASVSSGAWTSPVGLDFNVSGNKIFGSAGAGSIVTYATLGNITMPECYITITDLPSSGQAVAALWIDGSGNGYACQYTHGSPGSIIAGTVSGYAVTAIGASVSLTLSAGDQIGLEVNTTTNTVNAWSATGGTWTQRASRSNSTHTSARRVGLAVTGTAAGLDDFGGGAVTAAATSMTPQRGPRLPFAILAR